MLKIISMILMVAVLMFAIIKKYHVIYSMLFLAIAVLGIWTLMNGESVMGKSSGGSYFLDLFELIRSTAASQMQGNILNIMCLFGYVAYMKKLKASDLFAVVLARPIKKIFKNPYILAAITAVVGGMIQLVVPSALSQVALLLATFYPILLAVGVSKATSASAIVLATVFRWGPGDSGTNMMIAAANITEITVADFWVKYQIPMFIFVFITILTVFPITSKYFDKKENAQRCVDTISDIDPKSFGLPSYYAVFPLLPLVFILLFSSVIIKSVTISIVAANFLSLFIVILFEAVRKKSLRSVFDEAQSYFDGAGDFIKYVGFLLIVASIFSAAINKIGGMELLIQWLTNTGGTLWVLTVIGALLVYFVVIGTNNSAPNIPLFTTYFASVAKATDFSFYHMMNAMCGVVAFSSALCPVAGYMMAASAGTDTPVTVIMKRNIIPSVAISIVAITYNLIAG